MRTGDWLSVFLAAAAFSLLLPDSGSTQSAQTTSAKTATAVIDRERRSRISEAILAGECATATTLAIEAGDFDLAEQVLRLCTPKIEGAVISKPAPPPQSVPSKIATRHPDWRRKPTLEEVAGFYPKSAALARIKGRVVVKCDITINGLTDNCSVISEEPLGYGFSDAALRLARISEFTPMILDGEPVLTSISIPFVFNIPDSMLEKIIKSFSAK